MGRKALRKNSSGIERRTANLRQTFLTPLEQLTTDDTTLLPNAFMGDPPPTPSSNNSFNAENNVGEDYP
jgi:hypothetical protein